MRPNLQSLITVFENHKKVSFYIASKAKSTFWVDKSSLKMPKIVNFGEFLKNGQTVLPDRSLLLGQTLLENAKIQKFKNSNGTYRWFSNTVYLDKKLPKTLIREEKTFKKIP